MARPFYPSTLAKDKLRSGHRAFYESVILALLVEPTVVLTEPAVPAQARRPNYQSLPPIRLIRPIGLHVRVAKIGHGAFFVGIWTRTKGRPKRPILLLEGLGYRVLALLNTTAAHCNIALCINCFEEFHNYN